MKLMIVPSDAMTTMGAVAALGGGFQIGQDTAADRPGRRKPLDTVAAVIWLLIALALFGLEVLTLVVRRVLSRARRARRLPSRPCSAATSASR